MTLTKRLTALTLAGIMLLAGCSSSTTSSSSTTAESTTETTTETTEVEVEIVPGGTADGSERKELNLVYTSEIEDLNYLKTTSATVGNMTDLTMDPLVQYNYLDQVVPGMADEWEVSDDGLTWTFHLRDELYWYTNEGEIYGDLVAQDFVDSLQYTLTAENAVSGSGHVTQVILNAQEYLDGTLTDFSQVGVSAPDDKTVVYTLFEPCSYFLAKVTTRYFYPISTAFMEETGDIFGTSADTILTSGPYFFDTFDPQNRQIYVYNPNYWDVENIYISKINYTYNTQSDIAITLFERGEIDDASIPDDVIEDYMENPDKLQYVVKGDIKINTSTFKLNYTLPTYDEEWNPEDWQTAAWNSNFRKSLAFGIDKFALSSVVNPYIAEDILNNTLTPSAYAFNSQGVDYTDVGALKEYSDNKFTYDPDLALEYRDLAIAELEGQVEFPINMVFTYKGTSTSTGNMLQVLAQQLQTLFGEDYINVVINGTSQSTAEMRVDNNYSVFWNSYNGNTNDPYSYAGIYHSTNALSINRGTMWLVEEYIDEDGVFYYDKLVDIAQAESIDVDKRFELFAEAEAFLLEEALVIPFYENAYSFKYTNIQPFYCYHGSAGLDSLRGAKVLDEQLTAEQYAELEAQITAEKAALAS